MKHLAFIFCVATTSGLAATSPEAGQMCLESLPSAHFQFVGPVGERVQANVDHWLLCAPQSNPGMLEMFRVRDRQPTPQLVPWAGEFIGKYLLSAVAALRMTDDPRLRSQVSNVVASFIATQSADGYLGPFPREIRLLKNWDLWGHYHAIQALVMWHQQTGDGAALEAARKAADLVCRTYLDTGRRVFDAGDAEMNMTILTGMAIMYRLTGEPRYLRMAREVEKDWERAGDYLRAGLDGREYFQSPRPRWESLHDLQGLIEMWRITGEAKYHEAFIHHWRSIRRWDRRNSGAFSSGEQATGNPYAPTAIETCCTVAWMALTIDYHKLTGDPRAADELELSTLNGGLGAQHESGRWWTYNTPMDGVREASAHTIVFQARAGTPELNCCSVNGPRVLGMLSDWSVMSQTNGLVVNSYLPGVFDLERGGSAIQLQMDRDYPRVGAQQVTVKKCGTDEWSLRLRIPGWSGTTHIEANFAGVTDHAVGGSYLEIRRHWRAGDAVTLTFDFGLRSTAGANETAGKVSLYRGPLLLAWDQAVNEIDADRIPPINLDLLAEARTTTPLRNPNQLGSSPWVQVDLATPSSVPLHLVDFASAGGNGTPYRSWLPVLNPPPPPAFTRYPRDGERVRPGLVQFQWRATRPFTNQAYRLEISTDENFTRIVHASNCTNALSMAVELPAVSNSLAAERWWRVVTVNAHGETRPEVLPSRFHLDPKAPSQILPAVNQPGPNGEILLHSLRQEAAPKFGILSSPAPQSRGPEGTRVDGRGQMLVYPLSAWPEGDFSVATRVRVDEMPNGRLAQIFSAWTASMDDPLRLSVEGGKLFARIEAGQTFGTGGTPISAGTWHHVAAVKQSTTLYLFLDGKVAGSCTVPEYSTTTTHDCALGGNPRFSGNEFLAATFADFGLWERALSPAEIQQLATKTP